MAVATVKLTIEKDGKIKIVTDEAIPAELHANADELLDFLHKKAGGTRETTQLHEGHVHQHEHGHAHVHTGVEQ